MLHGRLLIGGGRTRRLTGRGDAEGAPLWWPAGKVAGEYLPRWLAEQGVAPQGAKEPPEEGITIRRPLRECKGRRRGTSTSSRASSAAPTPRSGRSDAGCARRASAEHSGQLVTSKGSFCPAA